MPAVTPSPTTCSIGVAELGAQSGVRRPRRLHPRPARPRRGPRPRSDWVGCANELGAGYAADGYAAAGGDRRAVHHFRGGRAKCRERAGRQLRRARAGRPRRRLPGHRCPGGPPRAAPQPGRRRVRPLPADARRGDLRAGGAHREDRVRGDRPGAARGPGAQAARLPAAAHRRRRGAGGPACRAAAGGIVDLTDHAAALAGFRDAAGALLAGTRPTVLADVLVARMDCGRRAARADRRGRTRLQQPALGQAGGVDESGAGYVGVYAGAASTPRAKDAVEGTAAALLSIGVQFTDLTSGFFSQRIDTTRLVEVGPGAAAVAGRVFAPVEMADALAVLTELVGTIRPTPSLRRPAPAGVPDAPDDHHDADPLGQATLWDLVCDAIRPGDLVLADQGTSFYGMGASPVAPRRGVRRPAAVGLDRLHPARAARRRPRCAAASSGAAHRGRRRPAHHRRAGHDPAPRASRR